MITTRQTMIAGNDRKVWFAYVDGVMLRGKSGVGRHFLSEAAARKAAAKAALSPAIALLDAAQREYDFRAQRGW